MILLVKLSNCCVLLSIGVTYALNFELKIPNCRCCAADIGTCCYLHITLNRDVEINTALLIYLALRLLIGTSDH